MFDDSRYSILLEDNDDRKDSSEFFTSVECKSIEIWQQYSGEFVEEVKSHRPDEVVPWIRNSIRPEAAAGGLRLLIATGSDELDFTHIFLSVEAFKECMDVFHIPHEYMDKVFVVEEGVFKYSKDSQRICWIVRNIFFASAISYSPEENLTTGLILTTPSIGEVLGGKILASRAYICHPMLVPTLALSEVARKVSLSVDSTLRDVGSLEKNVGLREGFRENEEFMRQADEALRIGTDVRARLSNWRAFAAVLEVLLENTQKAIPDVVDKAGSMDTGPAQTVHHREHQRCAEEIRDRIESITTQTKCLLRKIDNLEHRAALQTSALHTLFAQRDSRTNLEMAKVNHQMARDSARLASAAKRDSSSMKTIAILTTVFLPGTFVSALFSTPLVESDPSQFWVYWAITIPLTGLVMGLWAMWMYWINGKNRIKDEEAAKAVGSDEDNRKGNKPEKND